MPQQTIPTAAVTPPVHSREAVMETPDVAPTMTLTPTLERQTLTPSFQVPVPCALGLGLRKETETVLLKFQDHSGLVMSSSFNLSEANFPELSGWIKVLGAPSLQSLEQKAARAEQSGLPYDGLGYGLETSQTTPEAEWQDLVGSTQKARAMADRYEKMLVMGPGFRLMSKNEDKYPAMAALADLWIFQTQQLQKNPPGPVYRQEVERIIALIRSGNPSIPIWAQITLPPDREPDAREWLAYRAEINDLVDGTYIGVYTWERENETQLIAIIEEIITSACESQ